MPRSALVAVGGLAALTAWTGLSILWAPIAGAAADDFQRLLLYLFAFVAALAVLRPPAVRRLVEPVLLASIVAAALYGLSERLLPGVFSLQDAAVGRRPVGLAADVLERDGRADGHGPGARRLAAVARSRSRARRSSASPAT